MNYGERSDVAVSIRNLRVRRGGRLIVDGISLDIARGAVTGLLAPTGLLGPSGSGKTTLHRDRRHTDRRERLLCGLLVPREAMPSLLEGVSWLLPLTYAYDALARVTTGDVDGRLWLDVVVVVAAIVLALALGATTLRRRTP